MTSKIVVNNIEPDAGISSVTVISHVAGHDNSKFNWCYCECILW